MGTEASMGLQGSFVALLVITLGLFGWMSHAAGADETSARRRAAVLKTMGALGVLMAATGLLAEAGVLSNFDVVPPPAMGMLLALFILSFVFSFSRAGTRMTQLPFAVLVGFQAFRFPLELLLHWSMEEGLNPVQMTYEGYNFDIVTGLTAIVVGLAAWRRPLPRAVLWAWNFLGLGLLLTIVGVAVASMPMFQAFGPEHVNRWVFQIPFIWLPVVFVQFALVGHLLVFRKLVQTRNADV